MLHTVQKEEEVFEQGNYMQHASQTAFVLQHQAIPHIHRQLCETKSFAASNVNPGRHRWSRTIAEGEAVLQKFDEQPGGSTRGMAKQFQISQAIA